MCDRFFLFNEKGDLIIAKLSPKGYDEVSRAHLLEPTNTAAGRDVLWSHPAFANRHMYARNDKEIICVDLVAAIRLVGASAAVAEHQPQHTGKAALDDSKAFSCIEICCDWSRTTQSRPTAEFHCSRSACSRTLSILLNPSRSSE
jgi:hypothetical protein